MKTYNKVYWLVIAFSLAFIACSRGGDSPPTPPTPPVTNFTCSDIKLNSNIAVNGNTYYDIGNKPIVRLSFYASLDRTSANTHITLSNEAGSTLSCSITFENGDSTVILQPVSNLLPLSKFRVSASTSLQSKTGGKLSTAVNLTLISSLDLSDKFPRLSDDALLDLVQKQTFKYIWDFAHPTSGMIREGSQHGADIVTAGGTGFGIMGIITGVERGFITRAQGLARMTTITKFLDEKATPYHGAFAHWINGATGATMPFSTNDNGGDLIETAFLMQGLITAREYFKDPGTEETALRTRINKLWNNVDWDWYRQGGQNVLYWHWSADKGWAMNMKIQGWNEGLVAYVLAASSTTHTIPKIAYTEGWTKNGAIKNDNTYYGVKLPLGSQMGGPLFFAHYSFLGLDPRGLTDEMGVNYWTQNVAHSQINNKYCIANPNHYYGYGEDCWGLTASTGNAGYSAHSPTNDKGVIAPTAALSSFPYTPAESKKALEFFYYKIGDYVWKDYGFVDAFNLGERWFSPAFLAIDQGPVIVMIENYRTGLLWNLFMSAPEVKAGLTKLGFQSPNI